MELARETLNVSKPTAPLQKWMQRMKKNPRVRATNALLDEMLVDIERARLLFMDKVKVMDQLHDERLKQSTKAANDIRQVKELKATYEGESYVGVCW